MFTDIYKRFTLWRCEYIALLCSLYLLICVVCVCLKDRAWVLCRSTRLLWLANMLGGEWGLYLRKFYLVMVLVHTLYVL